MWANELSVSEARRFINQVDWCIKVIQQEYDHINEERLFTRSEPMAMPTDLAWVQKYGAIQSPYR